MFNFDAGSGFADRGESAPSSRFAQPLRRIRIGSSDALPRAANVAALIRAARVEPDAAR